ncbi:GNAT family N-acetyltransferase [Streptomyces sp. AC495_CC817]|uniref:GNAT family N-acetyltransferase n=1 Tax=Streptomyces sp. AC495_CC817 TaxID=2823900 RepID=UPI001C27D46F|nr:GNAT family N-acetyltransferase [Streptomyces sp. AC495_CC817]
MLSPLAIEDAPEIHAALADPELRQWLPLPEPYPLELAEAWCGELAPGLREAGTGLVLGVRTRGGLVGSIDVKRVDWRARTAELSYWTAAPHRGRGLMPAAVSAVTDWLLGDLAFERIELRIAPENLGSLRVAEKSGFVREGVARNAGFTDAGRTDLVIHSRISTDARR